MARSAAISLLKFAKSRRRSGSWSGTRRFRPCEGVASQPSPHSSHFGNRGNGVGGAHKVANAVFHLRALQCISTRCHECVQGDVRAAAVFEDDVQYVEGVTPAGTAHTPHTLQSAGRERQRDTMRDASVIRDTSVRHVHDTPVRHVLRSAPGRRGTPACSAS